MQQRVSGRPKPLLPVALATGFVESQDVQAIPSLSARTGNNDLIADNDRTGRPPAGKIGHPGHILARLLVEAQRKPATAGRVLVLVTAELTPIGACRTNYDKRQ